MRRAIEQVSCPILVAVIGLIGLTLHPACAQSLELSEFSAAPLTQPVRVAKAIHRAPEEPDADTFGGSESRDAAPNSSSAFDAASNVQELEVLDRTPLIELMREAPYKLYERPIPEGEVYAAEQDEELARWNIGGKGDRSFLSNRPGFHPGPRVRVDVSVTRGRLPKKAPRDRRTGLPRGVLSEESLLAQARSSGYWRFRLCYEQGLRHDPKLRGASRLALRIAASGRVTQVQLVKTEIKDREAVACLVRKAKTLRFAPGPARRIGVALDVQLWPGDAPLPERRPKLQSPAIEHSGVWDPGQIAGGLESAQHAIERCFSQGRIRDAELWGRLELRIELDATGQVAAASEHDSHFPDKQVVACVVGIVKPLRFPTQLGRLRFIVAFRLGQLKPIPERPPLTPLPFSNTKADRESL